MTNELNETIEKIIAERTFSVEATEGVKALRDRVLELETKLDDVTTRAAKESAERARFREQYTDLATERVKLRAKIKADEELVIQAASYQTQAAVANAQVAVFREAMNIVFRPSVVRESVHKNGTSPEGYVTENTTTERSFE